MTNKIDKDLLERVGKISLEFQREYGWRDGQAWLKGAIARLCQDVRKEKGDWKKLYSETEDQLQKERALSDRLREILRQILSLTKHRKVPVAQIHDLAIKALGGE